MKRLILTAALALLALPAISQALVVGPPPTKKIYFWAFVGNAVSAPPGQPVSNTLVIRPSLIYLFSDGSWDIGHLRWTGWGSGVAHATGISSSSDNIPNAAEGKRINTPGQITLSNPGRFQGHEVYRCFALTVPPPASDLHGCLRVDHGYGFLLG